MKFPARAAIGARPRVTVLAVSAVGLFAIGCVNLEEPAAVKACAGSIQGCTNDSVPVGKDAAADRPAPGPDVLVQNDTRTPEPDLPPAGPDVQTKSDLAADVPTDLPGSSDTAGGSADTDNRDAGAGDTRDALLQDLLGPDSADALGPDLVIADTAKSDLPGPDASPDVLQPDLAKADVPGPDLGKDLAPDNAPDAAPDQGSDVVKNDTVSGNCISQIIAAGYSAGTAPPCSACKENSASLAAKCTAMLDCLAPPKTSSDFTNCLNSVAGSSVVADCVTALTAVGCPNGY